MSGSLVVTVTPTRSEAPLPLCELQLCVSEDTYSWLEEADEKERAWEKIKSRLQFFQTQKEASETSNTEKEAELLGTQPQDSKTTTTIAHPRVCYWTSSLVDPDGTGKIGEIEKYEEIEGSATNAVTVAYILSDNWQGFGDQLWAASRHISNQIADPDRCRELLGTLVQHHETQMGGGHLSFPTQHPLTGKRFLELGAGAALPSWTAMWCGARVVASDQAIAGRIRCTAECAERNWREMKEARPDVDGSDATSSRACRPQVCPYDWGTPVEEVTQALSRDGGDGRFDVIVATECCFMPWFYAELLDSIDMLLSNQGVALLSFALHGNVSDEEVWGIIDLARDRSFQVEQLQSQQLTPQKSDMKSEQALVHTLRLSRGEAN